MDGEGDGNKEKMQSVKGVKGLRLGLQVSNRGAEGRVGRRDASYPFS